MKKFFTLVAMATTALAANAQVESAFMDVDALGIGTDLVTVAAGTEVCASSSVSMKVAYADSYKKGSLTAASDAVNTIVIDGTSYSASEASGIQGNTNPTPKTNDMLGTLESDGTYTGGQNSGAVFKLDVTADGFLYVFSKVTGSKQYLVWEGNAAAQAAKAVAYSMRGHASVAEEQTSPTFGYDLPADENGWFKSDDNYLTSGGKQLKYIIPYTKNGTDYEGLDATTSFGSSKADGSSNGLAVIAFPVYAEAGSYYVCALGSKITCNGFVFVPGATSIGTVTFAAGESAVAGVAEAKAEAAAPVKVITANGVQIGKFNVAGQQVK